MHEITLTRIALVTAILGIVLLTGLVLFIKPEFVGSVVIPQDDVVVVSGTILDVYYTKDNATLLVIDRVLPLTTYIDTHVPVELIGSRVNVTGTLEDELFFASSVVVE